MKLYRQGTLALQAYGRALELDGGRLYSACASGAIHLALGQAREARAAYGVALDLDPAHPPARCGAAAALLASARRHVAGGAPGQRPSRMARAAAYLFDAAALLLQGMRPASC